MKTVHEIGGGSNAIEAQLSDMLIRDTEPGATLFVSRISESISLAAGEESHTLSVPGSDVVHAASEIPIMGTITWI